LLQTANAAPSVALALPAGALADVLDRRRLIIATQGAQLAIAALLLALTFAVGAGSTLGIHRRSSTPRGNGDQRDDPRRQRV
jgi:MFS family permease